MAKNRLSFFSYSGDDPEIALDESRFTGIESAYSALIPVEARGRLVTICNQYLFARRTEIHCQSWSDVAAALPLYERAIEALWSLSFPEGRKDDAETELETLFERHLKQAPVAVYPDRGEIDIPGHSGTLALIPNYAFLTRMTMSLRVALSLTQKEVEQQRKTPDPKPQFTPFQRWILDLTDWAKAFALPRAPYIEGTLPNKFAHLVAALHQIMPSDLRETGMETAEAAAAKIKRARAAGSKYEREQKQATIRRLNAPFGGK